MGITNMAATIPGFLVPAVVGALTHGKVIIESGMQYGGLSYLYVHGLLASFFRV